MIGRLQKEKKDLKRDHVINMQQIPNTFNEEVDKI